MFRLRNGVQHYPWGSPTWIPEFVGEAPTEEPVAEVWIGTHPLVPSVVDDGTGRELREVAGELPFMVKLLAADQPLSLQVHPARDQARAGYAAEEAAGVPRDAKDRVYKDENHKPEMVYALTTFDTLIGFRPVAEVLRVLEPLGAPLTDRVAEALREGGTLVDQVAALLSEPVPAEEVDAVVAACTARVGDDVRRAYATAVEIAADFPGDVGVVVSLLLNRMTLQPGEAAYLGAGIVHAHLKGLCVEVMATSDNVLRAGLTTKHVDPEGLVTALEAAEQLPAERLAPEPFDAATQLFAPGEDVEFALAVSQVAEPVRLASHRPAVALCTGGQVELGGTRLRRGESVFLTAEDGDVTATGLGEVALAFDPS